jgi:hypothetical protein
LLVVAAQVPHNIIMVVVVVVVLYITQHFQLLLAAQLR